MRSIKPLTAICRIEKTVRKIIFGKDKINMRKYICIENVISF